MEKAQKSILSMISEVGAAITSSLVLEEVLSTIAQTIAEALDVWECDKALRPQLCAGVPLDKYA